MRVSDRKLPEIEPGKVWITPLSETQYQIWPLPSVRRGSGHRKGGHGGPGDHPSGGDGNHAVEDEDDPDNKDSADEDASDEVAVHREIIHLLDEGLAAMRDQVNEQRRAANGSKAAEGTHGDGDQPESDPDPDAPQDSDSSSSSSSSSPDDESPPAAPAVAAAGDAVRGTADAAWSLPCGCGIIRYYDKFKNFTAECRCVGHVKCIKTRTSTQAAAMATSKHPSVNMQAKGRPLGYLAAWLLDGSPHSSKAEHWLDVNEILATAYDKRTAARTIIAASPQGRELLQYERPLRDHEANEPHGLA